MLILASSVCGLFKWRQFEPEVILLAVGWYLRFSLSYRDMEELLAERGRPADHVTVWRWVQRYAPEMERRLRSRLNSTNDSWRVDETYMWVKGKWVYLYRAVDSTGAPDPGKPAFSLLLGSLAHDRRLRSDSYDSQRPGVLECGGCEGRSTAPLHCWSLRGDQLSFRSSIPIFGSTTKLQHFRTRWQVVQVDDNNPNIVALKCLGDIEGPRWLDGRTADGTVGLASTTEPPFTGTKWEVRPYPVPIDQP